MGVVWLGEKFIPVIIAGGSLAALVFMLSQQQKHGVIFPLTPPPSSKAGSSVSRCPEDCPMLRTERRMVKGNSINKTSCIADKCLMNCIVTDSSVVKAGEIEES